MAEPEEITIIVHNATGLKSKLGGGHKFFIVFGLSETKYQTSVVVDTDGGPVWNEENVVTVSNMKDEVFLVAREKDNVLGQILIPISSINGEKGQMQKQSLQPHKNCKKPQGELTYQCFISKYRDPNNPIVEETAKDNTNVGKKKFKLSFFRKEPGKQLEKITEVDSYRSNEPTADPDEVEEITLEELVSKNTHNGKIESDSKQNDEDSQEISRETLVEDNENDGKKGIKNGIDQSSPKPMPRRSKKKEKEKVGNASHKNAENVNSEEQGKDQDTYEKNKKKRFSLKFLKRKKLLDETKKALGKDDNVETQTSDYQNEEIDSLDELLEKNSNTLDETDKASEKSDLTSVSSMNSQHKENDVSEVTEEPVQKIFYTEDSYQGEADKEYDIEMKDIDIKMDRVVYDEEVPGPSDQQSDNETDIEENNSRKVSDEPSKDGEGKDDKLEKGTDLGDGATNNEPIVEIEIGGKVKKKKRFSLKLKGLGSDKLASSPSEEGGKPTHLGVTATPSSSSATSDKDKAKWKLNKKTPPEITKCTPNKGPVDEPTKVCIEGINLGTGKADILSLKVAGCDCLDTVEFESPEKIYCKTHFQFESRTGPIEIITKSGGPATLEDGFTFFDEIEKYTSKTTTKAVTFQAQIENAIPRYVMEQAELNRRSTEDISSLVKLRPKMRKLSRSSSETALNAQYVPDSFAEEQTESMFRVRQGRRFSEVELRPKRKAPPVPTEADNFAKNHLRRRASESAIKMRINIRGSDDSQRTKKRAPLPPQNAIKASRPVSFPLPDARRQKSLTPVQENEDSTFEKREELLEKIRKLEEEKGALQKDVTRLRSYIDNLVSRVMDRCPVALLQDNNLKTKLFL